MQYLSIFTRTKNNKPRSFCEVRNLRSSDANQLRKQALYLLPADKTYPITCATKIHKTVPL